MPQPKPWNGIMHMQTLDTDIQSLGGTGLGGFGGNSSYANNPLLWIILLAFLRGDNLGGMGGGKEAGAGVLAGQTQAKLDCLEVGQSNILGQISDQNISNNFSQVDNRLSALTLENRAIQDSIFRETSALGRSLAECCCSLKAEIAGVNTAIALQTNTITMNDNNNAQKILDKLCSNEATALQTSNANLRADLNKAEIIAALDHNHRGGGRGLVA